MVKTNGESMLPADASSGYAYAGCVSTVDCLLAGWSGASLLLSPGFAGCCWFCVSLTDTQWPGTYNRRWYEEDQCSEKAQQMLQLASRWLHDDGLEGRVGIVAADSAWLVSI